MKRPRALRPELSPVDRLPPIRIRSETCKEVPAEPPIRPAAFCPRPKFFRVACSWCVTNVSVCQTMRTHAPSTTASPGTSEPSGRRSTTSRIRLQAAGPADDLHRSGPAVASHLGRRTHGGCRTDVGGRNGHARRRHPCPLDTGDTDETPRAAATLRP